MKTAIAAFGMSLFLFSSEGAAQTITMDFTGGNGDTQVDQYTGVADAGWSTPWSSFVQGGLGNPTVHVGGNVISTNPLDSANPNYLQISYAYMAAGTNPSAVPNAGVRRQYDADVVDPSMDHTISFLFRVDALTGFTSTNDRIHLRGSDSIVGGTGSFGWQLDWSAGGGGWRVYNGDGNGTYTQIPLQGITQDIGTVYEITINMRPSSNQWDLTIWDGLNPSITMENLGFRTNGNYLDNYLGFIAQANEVGDAALFSIDRISIVQIPEPSTALMILVVGTLLAFSCLLRKGGSKALLVLLGMGLVVFPGISQALEGYDEANHPEYYYRFQNFDGRTVQNPNTHENFVGTGYDLSGVGWIAERHYLNATLISPQYVVVAAHRIPAIGETARFYGQDGQVFDSKIVEYIKPLTSGDVGIMRLENPVPMDMGITPYKSPDLLDYGSSNIYAPYVGRDIINYGAYAKIARGGAPIGGLPPEEHALYAPNEMNELGEGLIQNGDSGSPRFMPWSNPRTGVQELTLLGSHWSYFPTGALTGLPITTVINGIMAKDGYVMQWDAVPDRVWAGDGNYASAENWNVPTVPAANDTIGIGEGGSRVMNISAPAVINGISFFATSHSEGMVIEGGGLVSFGRSGIYNADNVRQEFHVNVALGYGLYVDGGEGGIEFRGDVANQGHLLYMTGSGENVVSGNISGTGGLAKDGAGELVVKTSQSYTGKTFIHNGTMKLENADIAASMVRIGNSPTARLELLGDAEVGMIEGGHADGVGVQVNEHTLTLGRGNQSSIFGGRISGDGGILKLGTGTLTLVEDSLLSGNIHVAQGGIRLGMLGLRGGGGNVAADISLAAGARLYLARNDNFQYEGVISGEGTVSQDGMGTSTFTSTWTSDADIDVNSGALHLAGGVAGGDGRFLVKRNAVLGLHGVVNQSVINHGTMVTLGEGEWTELRGGVSGAGKFEGNVRLASSYESTGVPSVLEFNGDLELLGDAVIILRLASAFDGGYDRLVVSGNLTLDGEFRITLLNGYMPEAGDVFDLFGVDEISGNFDSISLPALASGSEWDISELSTLGRLSVLSSYTLMNMEATANMGVIPEPSTYHLFIGAVAVMSLVAHRRHC